MQEKIKDNKKSMVKKIFDVVSTVVVVLYLVFAIVISVSIFSSMGNESGVPSLFGYQFMNVVTDSMEGDKPDSFNAGDLVICTLPDSTFSLKEQQIIAFRSTIYVENEEEKEIIKIHRIVDIDEDGYYITQGDHEEERDDMPVSPMRVLGVYTGNKISNGGDVFEFITSSTGLLICLVLPMAAFFIYALFKFIKAFIEYKMSKTVPADGELTEEQKQAAIAEYLAKQAAETKEENKEDEASE